MTSPKDVIGWWNTAPVLRTEGGGFAFGDDCDTIPTDRLPVLRSPAKELYPPP
jgi:hypothetical protein